MMHSSDTRAAEKYITLGNAVTVMEGSIRASTLMKIYDGCRDSAQD